MKQVDERKSIFNRIKLVEGTKDYIEFYKDYPELKDIDDECRLNIAKIWSEKMNISVQKVIQQQKLKRIIQKIPFTKVDHSAGMIASCTNDKNMDKIKNQISDTLINQAEKNRKKADKAKINPIKVQTDINIITQQIKNLAKYYGADLVGIAKLKKEHYYSYSLHFGDTKVGKYEYGIVIAQELDKDCINRAPHGEQLLGTMKGYAESIEICSKLVMHIKSLGYEAENDDFLCYLAPTMPIAVDAGIGQMGRSNMVVNKKFGNRLKMGVVMTNLPLLSDEKIDFGLTEFCKKCRLCANNCPSKSICNDNSPQILDGEIVWPHDEISCIEMWKKVRTDCGICMSSCPFSQGVNPELIENMKDNPEVMEQILAIHKEKYGARNYIKTDLPLVQFN